MNTPSESSFIHGVLNDIFEDTFRQSPCPLPWHISTDFLAASRSISSQSKRNSSSSTREESFFKPGATFPPLHHLPDQFAEPSPEQPLRDALLNSAIVLADLLGIRFILVSSRNGGTILRLRELTDQFHVVVLPVPEIGSVSGPEARLQQHDVPLLRETRFKPLFNVVELTGLDRQAKYSADGVGYEEALQWILEEGLRSLEQVDDKDDEELLPEDGEQVLFLYRSFPGANCVNAFRVLNFERKQKKFQTIKIEISKEGCTCTSFRLDDLIDMKNIIDEYLQSL